MTGYSVDALIAENERLRNALKAIVETPRRDGILTCHRIASEALEGGVLETTPAQPSLGDPVYYARVMRYLTDRWGGRCAYCGASRELQIDHLLPVSRGGGDEIQNLTLACVDCNKKKGTQTAAEFGFRELALLCAGAHLPSFSEMRRAEQRKEANRQMFERVKKDLGE